MRLSEPAREIAVELDTLPFPGVIFYSGCLSVSDADERVQAWTALVDEWYEWFRALPIATQLDGLDAAPEVLRTNRGAVVPLWQNMAEGPEDIRVSLSPASREIVNTCRRFRLSYDALRKATQAARKHLGMKPSKGARKLPRLLTEAQLRAFYEAIDRADKIQHQILLRLLFYTAIRVAELCAIKVADVDVASGKIFIDDGKGSKDRYVLFPADFRLVLKAYIESRRGEGEYLFESSHRRAYSTGRIRQIVREYAETAGIKVHPHLLRHQAITFWTKQGLRDSQIQLMSGHASKKSLEIYQSLGLSDVQADYDAAMRKVGI